VALKYPEPMPGLPQVVAHRQPGLTAADDQNVQVATYHLFPPNALGPTGREPVARSAS
jgi:hypothetical protein